MNNFISNLEIENFKSIRHQKIDGLKKINVFIGYPNVGKSNILEALSLLSYKDKNEPKISDLCRIQEFSELFFDGNIEAPIQIEYSDRGKVELKYGSDQELILSCITKYSQEEIIDSWSLNEPEDRWIEDAEFKIRKDGVIINPNRNLSSYVSKNIFKTFTIKKYDYKREILKDQSGFNSLFFPNGQNLFYILESNSELRKEVAELFDFYDLKLAFEKGNKYSLRILKTLNDGTIFLLPFHQIADTLQRLIFYKAAIKTNSDTALLFEEPEAHMFPPYVKKFTTDVVLDGTNQFFIATHSPYVLDAFIEEATEELAVFLVDYKNGETIINRLSEETLTEVRNNGVDLFFNLESYLTNG